MFNVDDSDSLAEDETQFEASNPSTSGNQISHGSPSSCKPDADGSPSLSHELSSLSSGDANGVEISDNIRADTLPANTDRCNQQQSQ